MTPVTSAALLGLIAWLPLVYPFLRRTLWRPTVYTISEIGKPPDFVLEVASEGTGRRDYTVKRDIYAGYGVTEYWRFDHTGGAIPQCSAGRRPAGQRRVPANPG